jgi:uncharacterized membrane protein
MSIFEGIMLVCFGVSWPISIARSLREKRVEGKSPMFMGIVCLGYISGIAHKIFYSLDWIILLYGLNMVMILVDLTLYFHYNKKSRLNRA